MRAAGVAVRGAPGLTTPALLAILAVLLAPVAPATPVPKFQSKLAPKTKEQTTRIRQLGTIRPLTPAQTLSTFVKISKDPVTTLGEPLTLSVRTPALDENTFLMLLAPDWVVPVKEGNTPPHASFPSGENAAFGGAFVFFGAVAQLAKVPIGACDRTGHTVPATGVAHRVDPHARQMARRIQPRTATSPCYRVAARSGRSPRRGSL